jgi:hypothetical protein
MATTRVIVTPKQAYPETCYAQGDTQRLRDPLAQA